MSVMLKKQRDGKTWRPCWYGEYTETDGKRKVINLNILWQGTPPKSLRLPGDKEFEDTREKAEEALAVFAEEARHKGRAEHLTERLIEAKTGNAPEYVTLAELRDRWLEGDYSTGYLAQCEALFKRFLNFMQTRNPKAVFLYQVRVSDARAFADTIREMMSRSTFNAYIGILRPAFDLFLPPGATNPFRAAKRNKKKSPSGSDGGSIHRKPFTAEELQRIIDAANGDDFMGGLITAAACTGQRRGDVCRLRWADVDLEGGWVMVKTSKTGEQVEIPVFSPLQTVLEARKGNGSDFVFPRAEHMLRTNPKGLTWRFKKLIALALDTEPTKALPDIIPADEVNAAPVIAEHVSPGARHDRILDTFSRYAAGRSVRDIAKETGRSKGQISYDLHAVQEWTRKRFIRSAQTDNVKRAIARVTRVKRDHGQNSGSIYDWHALRTTFVTIALAAGVPMELVRRVTGHTTVDIVLRHYFRPGRDTFKAALSGALPDVLTGAKTPKRLKPADELAALAVKVVDGSATAKDKKRLRVLAAKV